MTVISMHRRLTAIEARDRPKGGYCVQVPADADEDTIAGCIAEHRLRTGWRGPVLLIEPAMTEAEWLESYAPLTAR
jgi:hypothetical protein